MDSIGKGLAVTYPVSQGSFSFEYICKIATDSDYEGIGIATAILDTVTIEKEHVAWRASLSNQGAIDKYSRFINRKNGFMTKSGDYFMFGVGIPEEKKDDVVKAVTSISSTLESS